MDAKMGNSTALPDQFFTWDFVVEDGIVPILTGDEEIQQAASITCFLQLGSVPQIPGTGIPWLEYTNGNAQFNEVDSAIRNNLISLGIDTYAPDYDIVNGKIVVKVVRL